MPTRVKQLANKRCLTAMLQDDARLMKLVHDMLHPKSLPRGWTAEYIARTGEW